MIYIKELLLSPIEIQLTYSTRIKTLKKSNLIVLRMIANALGTAVSNLD